MKKKPLQENMQDSKTTQEKKKQRRNIFRKPKTQKILKLESQKTKFQPKMSRKVN